MQMNKAILRNSKKYNFVATGVSFFYQPAGSET